MKNYFAAFIAFLSYPLMAQQTIELSQYINGASIKGLLTQPAEENSSTVVLIIAGSGPTDRDGNNESMKNNSLKMLSDSLVANGYSTFRYDKRGVANSAIDESKIKEIRFDDFINDAKFWASYLKKEKHFNELIVAGHSQGSLIGMIIAQEGDVDGFISLAGAGRSIDVLLHEQLSKQMPGWSDMFKNKLDSIKNGYTVKYPAILTNVFHESLQPFLGSYMKYDPSVEIEKLNIPVLIIQGSTDLQTNLKDAEILKDAYSSSNLIVLKDMNHVFKESSDDMMTNLATYSNPELPLHPKLTKTMVTWLKESFTK